MVELLILIGVSIAIGCFSYVMYTMGDGYYGEDRMLISRKILIWIFRIALGVILTLNYKTYISPNELTLFICGYHLMSSIFVNGTYYQLKRWLGKEYVFHFFSHSINALIRKGGFSFDPKAKSMYSYLDLYAFIRILLFVLGYLMVNYEYY
tara:strand:+ start:3685 stop:4137 length:453 start_codon:yes stop_codon:yes gene_type:complete